MKRKKVGANEGKGENVNHGEFKYPANLDYLKESIPLFLREIKRKEYTRHDYHKNGEVHLYIFHKAGFFPFFFFFFFNNDTPCWMVLNDDKLS